MYISIYQNLINTKMVSLTNQTGEFTLSTCFFSPTRYCFFARHGGSKQQMVGDLLGKYGDMMARCFSMSNAENNRSGDLTSNKLV